MVDSEKAAEYLSIKDFATRAGVTSQRIYQLISKNVITDCKELNGHRFINVAELQRFPKVQPSNTEDVNLQDNLQNSKEENVNLQDDLQSSKEKK